MSRKVTLEVTSVLFQVTNKLFESIYVFFGVTNRRIAWVT